MKKLLSILVLATSICACSKFIVPGTEMAANQLAVEYVNKNYGDDFAKVTDSERVGNMLTVGMRFGDDKSCTIRLVTDDQNKDYGWEVIGGSCSQNFNQH